MKKGLGEYIISFSSLKPGRYEYEFEVDDTFFEHFEQTEITHGSLAVKLEVQRQPMMLALAFNITGEVELTCDRCGDLYRQPVSGHRRLVVHIGGEEMEDEDDIIMLPAHEHAIDVSKYIYEFIVLFTPQRRVHPEDENGESGCDPEVIKKLNELKVGDDQDGLAPSDPRWAALKGLKFDDN